MIGRELMKARLLKAWPGYILVNACSAGKVEAVGRGLFLFPNFLGR